MYPKIKFQKPNNYFLNKLIGRQYEFTQWKFYRNFGTIS